MTQHPYCYPGTNVYKNRLDIQDADALEAFERAHSARRHETMPRNLPISVAGYRAIHRFLLKDVYDWAGEYRWVNTGRGAPFCKSDFIAGEMETRFKLIRSEKNLRGLAPDAFAARVAEHLNELNAIHPFLDGNGRTNRAFLEELAAQAGHECDLARIVPDEWNQASVVGFNKQDHAPMRKVISATLMERG